MVYTDFLQFFLAVIGTTVLAYFSVERVGGLNAMLDQLRQMPAWPGNELKTRPAHVATEADLKNMKDNEYYKVIGMQPGQAEVNNGNIIANNIFSIFGYGYEYYNWVDLKIDDGYRSVINLWGQWEGMSKLNKIEFDPNSGMKSILVQGNMIYTTQRTL